MVRLLSSTICLVAAAILSAASDALKLPPQSHANMTELYFVNAQAPDGDIIYVQQDPASGQAQYRRSNGTQVPKSALPPLALRVANGGGGQTGVVGRIAIEYLKRHGLTNVAIGWRGTNTDGTIQGMLDGIVDVGIVYDIHREMLAIYGGEMDASGRELPAYAEPHIVHVWMDHFNYIGPTANPAHLVRHETIEASIDKIMRTPKAFWLTRDDKSTINVKESDKVYERVSVLRKRLGLAPRDKPTLLGQLMAEGALEMAKDHPEEVTADRAALQADLAQYQDNIDDDAKRPRFPEYRAACKLGFLRPVRLLPAQATMKAEQLGYYTMSDQGIFLTFSQAQRQDLGVYVDGVAREYQPYMLNPADALLHKQAEAELAKPFFAWLESDDVQDAVVKVYTGKDPTNKTPLFTEPMDLYKKHRGESWKTFEARRVQLDAMETWDEFEAHVKRSSGTTSTGETTATTSSQ